MSLLPIFVLLFVLFGGGFYGRRAGWYGSGGSGGGVGLILLVLFVILLLGGFGGTYMGGYWHY